MLRRGFIVGAALPASFGLLFLAACGTPAEVEIELERPISADARTQIPEADAFLRFTGRAKNPGASTTSGVSGTDSEAGELPFVWKKPAGWEELPPRTMRLVNLRPGGDERAECYVTFLGGDGGGMVANVNRWRDQLGLEPIGSAEVDALPEIEMFKQPATLVELVGTFKGMSGPALEEWGLLGAIQEVAGQAIFVKMTGPLEVVEAERDGFIGFCASMLANEGAIGESDASDASGASDASTAAPAASAAAAGSGNTSGMTFELPEGWRDAGPRTMRAVNLAFGTTGQCYISLLGGDGGGLLNNYNRWAGQIGHEALTDTSLAALPTVKLLGQDSPLFAAEGAFEGMGAEAGDSMVLFGVAMTRASGSVFVKLTGTAAEAESERERFIAFVESLEDNQ